jgi:hypothetical protein
MRIKHVPFYLLAVIGCVVFTGCDNKVLPPADFGYNFIPIDTGRYYIYEVDSIRINLNATPDQHDTFHYQMKEFYPYRFLDANNDTVICCTRFYRQADSLAWTPLGSNVWWFRRTTTRFEKTEENLTYVKMTYPIDLAYSWDGNAYNILDPQDYFYGPLDVSFNDGTNLFNNTITVVQQFDTTNLIKYNYASETYARDIGMVNKTRYIIPQLVTDTSQWVPWPYPGKDWYQIPKLKRIKDGSIVIYKLIDHGFE